MLYWYQMVSGGVIVRTNLDSYIQTAIHGSELYYQYLREHQRGLVENKVERIQQSEKYVILTLRSALKFPDNAQVRIQNQIYTIEQIKPIEYNEKTNQLTVRPLDLFRQELICAAVHDVTVVSDLRFLVKRIENWYRSYGSKIHLPVKTDKAVPMPSFSLRKKPSLEQEKAIHGALFYPFSYIWGAPGTGKTQFVLAHCILAYVRAGKIVWITAPTNNAVEQMLYGVLPVLEGAGVQRQKVLRMGVPSQRFRSQYPEICEDAVTAREYARIDDEILQLKSQMADNQEQQERLACYRELIEFERAQIRWETEMPSLLQQITAVQEKYQALENDCLELQGRRFLTEADRERLQKDEAQKQAESIRLTKQAEYYSCGWRKWFCKGKREQALQLLQQEMQQLDQLREEIHRINMDLAGYTKKDAEIRQQQDVCDQQFAEKQEEIQRWTSYWNPLVKAAGQLHMNKFTAGIAYLRGQTQRARKLLEDRRPKYFDCATLSEETLRAARSSLERRYADAQARKSQIEATESTIPIQDRLVLAATVDTCLHRLPPDEERRPAHIFLDEAGYCAMIKGTALLAYSCPVTFLGDHMQLPPVCEMSDKQIALPESSDVCLWGQSALYAEDAFSQQPEQIAQTYIQHRPARFEHMTRLDLTHTYRFGEELASVLAQFVYSRDFRGDSQHSTDIYFLHAPKAKQAGKKRMSQAECEAIAAYVCTHPEEQIGIITPYKNQREAIRKALPGMAGREENILTVHGSQGREWDTVLLSVVDTQDMWFTDSNRLESNGKKLINTAVSRAKKKLILVCDAAYWEKQSSQLIGHLLSIATHCSI